MTKRQRSLRRHNTALHVLQDNVANLRDLIVNVSHFPFDRLQNKPLLPKKIRLLNVPACFK